MWPNRNHQASGQWGYNTGLGGDQDYVPFASNYQDGSQHSSAWNQSSMPTINSSLPGEMDLGAAGASSPASQSNQATTPNKVQLNARAAELKERLRKRRDLQGQASTTVDPSGDAAKGPAMTEGKKPKPGRTTGFVPHALPQLVSQPILPATGDDIADLISDIRSATNPEPSTQSAAVPKAANGHADKPAATPKSKATKNECHGEPEEGEITEKTPDLKNKILPVRETTKLGESASLPPRAAGSAAGLQKPLLLSLPPKPKNDHAKNGQVPFYFKKNGPHQPKRADPRGKAADITGKATADITNKNKATADIINKATTTGVTSKATVDVASPLVHQAAPAHGEASVDPKDTRGDQQTALADTPKKTTPQELSVPDRMELKNPVAETASEAIQAPMNTVKPSGGNAQNSSQLARVLAEDKDLRDWLELTHYHNTSNRANRLARWRRLMEIEREKQEILRQEEVDSRLGREPTMPFSLPTAVPLAPAVATSAAGLESTPVMQLDIMPTWATQPAQMQPAQMTTDPSDKSTAALETVTTTASTQPELQRLKREHGDDGMLPQRPEKQPRTEENSLTKDEARVESGRSIRGRGQRGGYRGGRRGSSRHRSPPPSYYENGYRRSASRERSSRHHSAGPPSYRRRSDFDFHEYQDASARYESYHGDRDRHYDRRSSPPRAYQGHRGNPNTIDLGHNGETRFFMVKSFNTENVHACMEDGLWTTQLQNQEMLTSAFAQCKNVILFFSVNQSKAFQGYARMATAPSLDTPAPKWMKRLHWESSPPFRVEWLCKAEMPFHAVHHLVNSLNESRSVIVGKDGQELENECGRDLFAEMNGLEESKRSGRLQQEPPSGPRHGGSDEYPSGAPSPPRQSRGGYRGRGDRGRGDRSRGGRGRGRGRPYVKREGSPS